MFFLMNSSEMDLKQEMMDEEMEDMMVIQVWEGFCLTSLLLFTKTERAVTTLERLWV